MCAPSLEELKMTLFAYFRGVFRSQLHGRAGGRVSRPLDSASSSPLWVASQFLSLSFAFLEPVVHNLYSLLA